MPKEPGPRCSAYSRHNRPHPGRVLFAKCAEDEIMILLFSVASITSGAYICRTREHLTIAQCAIESPSSRFSIANAVFSHDADADALAFEAVSSMLIHFQALVHKHRAIGKLAGREALERLWIGLVVMEAGVGPFLGDQAAGYGPGPIPDRKWNALAGIGQQS